MRFVVPGFVLALLLCPTAPVRSLRTGGCEPRASAGGGAALFLAAAQQRAPDQELPSITVDVNLVNILFTVRDKRGGLVPNLTKDDFTIFEEGKAQDVRYFTRESNLPLTIGLLVDVSVSQQNLIEIERRAASEFFSSVLRPKDMAFLISFGPEAELLQDFTNSTRLLRSSLDQLQVRGDPQGIHPSPVPTASKPRGTILFDAVYLAADEKLKAEVGRKAMVLITDGVDQGSRYTREKAVEAAQKADAIVYSIHYVDPGFYGFFGGASDSDLRRMSDETGGREFNVNKRHPLSEAFRQIQEEMRSQYAIAYTPSEGTKDGSYRRIEIRPKNRDLKVQARKGYYAVARASK